MRKIVLDTNAYSRLIGGDGEVEKTLSQADKILLPVFVIAELLYGFKNGKKENWNRSVLKRFENKSTVTRFYVSDETVEIFSELFLALKKKGKPIPTHDIWVAACAVETGSVLVSYDKHFLEIDKLRFWKKLT
ncbi:MAG TPA: type II toxin-antitoxin system VapC family toxin [Phaeodactylibacter sp.]|nr:type II toxin-antitoxin system VapC family toxin [Phaeodactylibacter sp.]